MEPPPTEAPQDGRGACRLAKSLQVVSDSATQWTTASVGSSVWGFSRQKYWSAFPHPPRGDLPNPGIELVSLMFPALAGGFSAASTAREGRVGSGTKTESSDSRQMTRAGLRQKQQSQGASLGPVSERAALPNSLQDHLLPPDCWPSERACRKVSDDSLSCLWVKDVTALTSIQTGGQSECGTRREDGPLIQGPGKPGPHHLLLDIHSLIL